MIGVYFLVKRCSLLFLNAGNGTFALAPYMDANGEVDISMRYVSIQQVDVCLLTGFVDQTRPPPVPSFCEMGRRTQDLAQPWYPDNRCEKAGSHH